MKHFIWKAAIFFTTLLVIQLTAQEFKVPQNYSLVKKEDYKPYEKDVLAGIEFLENSPFDKNPEKRKEINTFLLKWMMGCPYVKIDLHSYVLEYAQKNKDFIMTFLGGWTRYAIEHSKDVNKFSGNLEGLRSIIKVYQNGKGIKEDKKVEKLVKLEKDSKLEEWLRKKLDETSKEEKKGK